MLFRSFQQYALFPHMTVEQNIAAALGRLDRARRWARTEELIATLRLEGTEKLLPRQLSGGQQQRAALARILASRPRAILLDEPLSALDSSLRRQLERELQEVLARFGGPAVWVSHDLGEVCRSCRRVCVLEDGRSSPAVGMRELIEAPGTAGAARISGCRNLVRACPGPEPGTAAMFTPFSSARSRARGEEKTRSPGARSTAGAAGASAAGAGAASAGAAA